jgi:hypothetical protein
MTGRGPVRRTPVTDEYVEAGESVVFVEGRLVVLSEIATSVLSLVGGDKLGLDDLTTRVVARHGEPGGVDAGVAVAGVVDELEGLGLVTRTP